MDTYSLKWTGRLSAGESGADLAPAVRIFARLLRGFDAPPALRLWNDAVVVPKVDDGKSVIGGNEEQTVFEGQEAVDAVG